MHWNLKDSLLWFSKEREREQPKRERERAATICLFTWFDSIHKSGICMEMVTIAMWACGTRKGKELKYKNIKEKAQLKIKAKDEPYLSTNYSSSAERFLQRKIKNKKIKTQTKKVIHFVLVYLENGNFRVKKLRNWI